MMLYQHYILEGVPRLDGRWLFRSLPCGSNIDPNISNFRFDMVRFLGGHTSHTTLTIPRGAGGGVEASVAWLSHT